MPQDDGRYWNEVEAIFAAALASGGVERSAILDAGCGARPDLRAEVESLLAAHVDAGAFITPNTLIAPGDLPDGPSAALHPGTRVGAFRLIERVAQGGMGDVYRGERVDGGFAQEVAIKLVAGRLIGDGTQRRFRAERQILASLQHPSIVSVVDGGVTADGQPYLAMEFVAGVPITEYCRARALGIDARLRLFTQLCAAVAFAHRHLVVHRDLKPANVLVTADGHVKVLDFGIAKLLEPAAAPAAATMALLPGPLTPDYSSPEQIRGLPVTTASDVYALGVMVYELAAGVRPYQTSGRTMDELLAIIVDRESPRPSAAARCAIDRRRLRGDLDAIVLKAIAKAPERRYDSAQALADDVRRFLDRRAVQAHEPSLAYLARKAVARHRAAFSVAAVCVVLLIAALVGALWQARIAERERARAEQRFQHVRQLANYVIYDLQDGIARLAGATELRRDMVQKSLQYLDLLAAEAGGDVALLLEIAGAYHRLGDVLGNPGVANLGDRDGPVASYDKARELYARVLAVQPGHVQAQRALAGLLLTESDFYGIVGQKTHAADALVRSRGIWASLVQSDPHDEANLRGLASAEISSYLRAGGPQSDDALPHLERALEIFQALSDARPSDLDRMQRVALCHRYLVTFSLRTQRDQEAMGHARRAAAIDARRLAANPHDAAAKLDYSTDLGQMAVCARRLGRLQEALDLYLESLSFRRELWAADPANVLARDRVMYTVKEVGALQVDLGHWDGARTHLREAIEHASALRGRMAGSAPQEMLIQSYFHLGRLEQRLGRDACGWFRRSVAAAPSGPEAMESFQYRAAVTGALDGARESLKSCPEP